MADVDRLRPRRSRRRDLAPVRGDDRSRSRFPEGASCRRRSPILEERFALASRVPRHTRSRSVGAGALLAAPRRRVGAPALYRFGRDRRYAGSRGRRRLRQRRPAPTSGVPLLDQHETPVEFVPPDDLRPGQVGTLIDFEANPLDVTATIVDLAVREVPRDRGDRGTGWYAQGRLEAHQAAASPTASCSATSASCSTVCSADGRRGRALRAARTRSRPRMQQGAATRSWTTPMAQGWFARRPDGRPVRVRAASASSCSCVGVALTIAARGVHARRAARHPGDRRRHPAARRGAGWMPQRTAKGTAVLRRTHGFRRFIDESEKDRARVRRAARTSSRSTCRTRSCSARPRSGRRRSPASTTSRPTRRRGTCRATRSRTLAFSSAIDGFTVTTSGTLTSTPPSTSGSSGFGGGGFSGGGGGGGGGSW